MLPQVQVQEVGDHDFHPTGPSFGIRRGRGLSLANDLEWNTQQGATEERGYRIEENQDHGARAS